MGTRGLLGLIIAGQSYATYNQFDCYPSGLMKDILKFILSFKPEDWDEMITKVKEIEWVDGNAEVPFELRKKYVELGYFNNVFGTRESSDWSALLYNTRGIKALEEILKGDLKHLTQNLDFLEDYYCDWAYFIDFEAKKFEVWPDGEFLEEISLENLSELDLDAYIEKLQPGYLELLKAQKEAMKNEMADPEEDEEDEEDEDAGEVIEAIKAIDIGEDGEDDKEVNAEKKAEA